ncbi:MAG TPA: hypothetical protein VMT30_06675 [Candidatus Saccharimonadia bacterium]|nr:hypothetical protein [Candidatus Saccharimonadia bacterium]
MTTRRAARSKPAKSTGAWKLWVAAVADMRTQWKRYLAILAVVTVPLNLFNLFPGLATDSTFNLATQIAAVIMNVALIWAIVEFERTGVTPGIGAAYYDGSVAIVRFLMSALLLVLMLVPAAFAATLYIIGFLAVSDAGTIAEQLILASICLLIAAVSGWWMVRFGLAPTIAVAEGARPLAALRRSRRLTLGRFWRVFSRYAALVFFIAVTAVPIALVTAGLSYLKLGPIPTIFFGLATTFTALPLLNLYLLKLYRSLESTIKA